MLLYKGNNKPITDPSSFRPICFIDSSAKLFERMVLGRFNLQIQEKGGLTIKQYGFRKG